MAADRMIARVKPSLYVDGTMELDYALGRSYCGLGEVVDFIESESSGDSVRWLSTTEAHTAGLAILR